MTDIKTFIGFFTDDQSKAAEIINFFQDRRWFDDPPEIRDGIPYLSDSQMTVYEANLREFLETENIDDVFSSKFSQTAGLFRKFAKEERLSSNTRFYITDFMLYNMQKEITLYTDEDMDELMQSVCDELTKEHGDVFTFFIGWIRLNHKTRYHRNYVLEQRYSMNINNQAYDMDEYLELLYYLFCPTYIEENNMYVRAAESMNYTDTWLYLAIHFICALRTTDLERIYHPMLPYSAQEVIDRIKDDTFNENDARYVILSINTRMCVLPLTPNKTKAHSGISSVKFCIPDSCEVHFGKLFALAEAHRQLKGREDMPIIRKISSYQEISRYMGDEIGELFLKNDFRSRSATKSYLQFIEMLADDILDEQENGVHVKGYMLAALARSHKGSYGEFAATTFEYLKDSGLSGMTPEFIVFELLERGVLSFIPSILLRMITDQEYGRMDAHKQTQMVQALDMTPAEIESVVSVVEQSREMAKEAVRDLVTTEDNILDVLHRIGSGQAFSKQPECMCLYTAMGKICSYPDRMQCVGCPYEIGTKSTYYLLISETNRLRMLRRKTEDEHEKKKYTKILKNLVLPKLAESLECIGEAYGPEVRKQYELMIKENT